MARCAGEQCRRWRPDAIVRYAKLGLRVDDAWYCSADCIAAEAVRRLTGHRPRRTATVEVPALRLGALLVHQGSITRAQLHDALGSQRESGLPLGAELLRLGWADSQSVLKALAAQGGVSYLSAIDFSTVHGAPGGLCADEVRALGIVPLRVVPSRQVLIVACAAPLPRAGLAALQQLTGWTPEPFLVSDADLVDLTREYGLAQAASGPRVQIARVRGFHDAGRRIADTALIEGSVKVTEAHMDPFTWIRVAGKSNINSLLIVNPADEREEEHRWRAATTSR